MCDADAGIITGVWMEGQDTVFPVFGAEKKCADFEALVDWQAKNGVPDG
jgi:hypothetical protein